MKSKKKNSAHKNMARVRSTRVADDSNVILLQGYTTCIHSILKNSEHCQWNDVTFVIGREEMIFHGMKAMFAMHSAVFELCRCMILIASHQVKHIDCSFLFTVLLSCFLQTCN